MRFIYLLTFASSLVLFSCGGKSTKKNTPIVDTTAVDTASIEQLEKELNDLEQKSAEVHNKIDSINNSIDK